MEQAPACERGQAEKLFRLFQGAQTKQTFQEITVGTAGVIFKGRGGKHSPFQAGRQQPPGSIPGKDAIVRTPAVMEPGQIRGQHFGKRRRKQMEISPLQRRRQAAATIEVIFCRGYREGHGFPFRRGSYIPVTGQPGKLIMAGANGAKRLTAARKKEGGQLFPAAGGRNPRPGQNRLAFRSAQGQGKPERLQIKFMPSRQQFTRKCKTLRFGQQRIGLHRCGNDLFRQTRNKNNGKP